MKNYLLLFFLIFGFCVYAQKDTISKKSGPGVSLEYLYGNRQGITMGIGGYVSVKGKRWYIDHSKDINGKRKWVALYPRPLYTCFNQGVLFQNNSSQTLIHNSQLQLFMAIQMVSLGTRLTFYTDYKTHSQTALTSEIGLGWKYVFLKYQYNYYFFKVNPFGLPRFNFALQVILPLK